MMSFLAATRSDTTINGKGVKIIKRQQTKIDFSRYSMTRILYISCTIFNAVLLLIMASFFFAYSQNSIRKSLDYVLSSNSAILKQKFNTLIQNADNTLKEVQTNKDLLAISKHIEDGRDNYFDQNIMDRDKFYSVFRYSLVLLHNEGTISYFSDYGDNVGYSIENAFMKSLPKSLVNNNSVLNNLRANIKYVDYIEPHVDYNSGKEEVFSIVRAMRDMYRNYGILVYDYKTSIIKDLINGFDHPEDYSISIFSTDGTLIYSTAERKMASVICSEYLANRTIGIGTVYSCGANANSCIQNTSTGWDIVLTRNNSVYTVSIRRLIVITLILFVSMFVLMALFLKILIGKVTNPLQRLTKQVSEIGSGKEMEEDESIQSREVAVLSATIRKALHDRVQYEKQIADAKERTLQAQFNALDAQLDPHMLYNTLSVIGMTGMSDGSMRTATMCSELANLLRYSLATSGQYVPLEKEIENTRNYLDLMKARYEDDFQFNIDVDKAVEHQLVPKLILQPIVENSFKHGFRDMEPIWIISIRVNCDEYQWNILVQNNGKHFSEQDLHRLNQLSRSLKNGDMALETSITSSHGLENTIYRLHSLYRGKETVRIENISEGVKVLLCGPTDMTGMVQGEN